MKHQTTTIRTSHHRAPAGIPTTVRLTPAELADVRAVTAILGAGALHPPSQSDVIRAGLRSYTTAILRRMGRAPAAVETIDADAAPVPDEAA